jgi:hypothetical protein
MLATRVGLVGLLSLGVVGCHGTGYYTGGKGASSASPAADPKDADTQLILAMYDTINQAFQRSPDDGVRALIAAQDPEDSADVTFARCVNSILPGATTLPRSKTYHFDPNIATTESDSGYTVSSPFVKNLHPKGRIYVTDVTVSDGGKPIVRPRRQVIVNGKAYQFSTC